jgi:hypothetical protein
MFFYWDSTMILLIPAILFTMYAQSKISGTFRKYSRVPGKNGFTASVVARKVLDMNGLTNVKIERVRGNLTDHYDPRKQVLRLSDTVHSSTSIAALGVAAHEAGHAIQHSTGYIPLLMRNTIAPAAGFGSNLSWILILVGLLLNRLEFIQIGIVFFLAVVIFQLITLPVEFNASKRAIALLSEGGIITDQEIVPAKKVLNAAALTYVAAALTAVMQLLRFIMLANRRR